MKTHATRGRWAHLAIAFAIAFAGIIVTAVLAVAVRFGHDMGRYLEMSTGLTTQGVNTSPVEPAVRNTTGGTEAVTPPTTAARNEDAIDPQAADSAVAAAQ